MLLLLFAIIITILCSFVDVTLTMFIWLLVYVTSSDLFNITYVNVGAFSAVGAYIAYRNRRLQSPSDICCSSPSNHPIVCCSNPNIILMDVVDVGNIKDLTFPVSPEKNFLF